MPDTLSTRQPQKQLVSVTFRCEAPDAKHVYLVGSFDEWDDNPTALQKRKEGKWSVTKRLPPGRYEYKFIIDDQWCCENDCCAHDLSCSGCAPNPYGTFNHVIDVA